jgi:hypothetical protein
MKTGGRIELAPYRDWGCTSAHRQNRCRVMAPGTFGMEKKIESISRGTSEARFSGSTELASRAE